MRDVIGKCESIVRVEKSVPVLCGHKGIQYRVSARTKRRKHWEQKDCSSTLFTFMFLCGEHYEKAAKKYSLQPVGAGAAQNQRQECA